MASSYTTNKDIEKPGNGDYVDTWNVPLNGDMTVVDYALGTAISFNATAGSQTLGSYNHTTRGLDTYSYIPLIINVTGAISANVTYTIPSGVGGQWIVYNTTTDATGGPWTVTFASGGGGTSQVIARSAPIIIYCDGTNVRLAASSPIPSGTAMLFYQASAPTGWTQFTGINDRVLRIVSGTGAGAGGSIAFSTYFSGSNSVGSTAITEDQMPSHTHSINDPTHTHTYNAAVNGAGSYGQISQGGNFSLGTTLTTNSSGTGISINYTGGSNGHTHTIPSLQYADVIICTKN